jgi:hypothetical protein
MTDIITKRQDIANATLSPSQYTVDEFGKIWIGGPDGPVNGKRYVELFDDFLGDVLQDPWRGAAGSSGATAPAILASGLNGRVRLAMGTDAGATMALNGSQLDAGNLNWVPSQGGLVMEAHVTVDAITSVAIFVGFTDQISALEMPWTLSTTTFTSNQTDGCGFLFDTAATTDTIRCVGVATDVDATSVDTGLAFVAATPRVFRIEVSKTGVARFFVDENLYATMTAAVTPTVALSPVIAGFSRTATTRLLDVDFIHVFSVRA